MLKIIDGIDLKELEKFGFIYNEKADYYEKKCLGTFNKFLIMNDDDENYCKGTIIFYNNSAFNTTLYLDTLYDLIQAGLVERI